MHLQALAQTKWEKQGKRQRATFLHCCFLQTAHCESQQRSKAHSYPQEGASGTATELQNDCDKWHMYGLYANLLRSMIQDWCIQHNKIPETPYIFYPGRRTLQPLFILRHIKHAAQKMQSRSSQLYAAFIDLKQAYDCIPRSKLWDHLCSCQMPDHILSIWKDSYHAA